MDLNEYWQENKRFLMATASGVVLFLVGSMVVDHFFRSELKSLQRSANAASSKLRGESMYDASQLSIIEKENEALKQAVEVLTKATAFDARPEFRIDPKAGAATNQYFATVTRVRDDLLKTAGRGNLRVPDDLGLPALSPTREAEIERFLEALDLVDRAVRAALAAGVQRIDKIEIRLDPKLSSRQGVGDLERTRVEISASGLPAPLVHFISETQAKAGGNAAPGRSASAGSAASANSAGAKSGPAWLGPLLIEKAEIQSSRTKPDEAVLSVTFVAARVT
jgi:hypothetical protein